MQERANHESEGAPAVRLRLLGGFELSIDGQPVELQPAVQRLIAFIALTPRGVSRSFAAFQLWPDKAERRALANLRSTLWRLNQIEVELVAVDATRLSLADGVSVDIAGELGGEPDIRSGTRDGIPVPFQTMLLDLLPDWYDDWLVVERERCRQLQLSRLEARARRAIDEGACDTAIQLALSALAIEGTRESAHRLVVAAHLAEGNESEARREAARYERCLARTVA